MNKQKIICGRMRAFILSLIDLASGMDTDGEDSYLEVEVPGDEVFFDPEEISASKTVETATRQALKLNGFLEDVGYPRVSRVLLSFSAENGIGFWLGMEDEPNEEQKQVIAEAFDGLDA